MTDYYELVRCFAHELLGDVSFEQVCELITSLAAESLETSGYVPQIPVIVRTLFSRDALPLPRRLRHDLAGLASETMTTFINHWLKEEEAPDAAALTWVLRLCYGGEYDDMGAGWSCSRLAQYVLGSGRGSEVSDSLGKICCALLADRRWEDLPHLLTVMASCEVYCVVDNAGPCIQDRVRSLSGMWQPPWPLDEWLSTDLMGISLEARKEAEHWLGRGDPLEQCVPRDLRSAALERLGRYWGRIGSIVRGD